MRRSKFALSGEPKLCDRRNAVPLSKGIAISDVWNRGCFAIEGAMRGTEVRRLPGNWSVLDRDAKAASETKMAKDLSLWCKAMLMSRHASQACKRCFERSTCGHRPPPCPAEERAYIDDMLGNANEVILQDDKDRKRSWTMPAACLSAILLSLVLLDSSRWEITSLTKEQLSTMVYGVSLFALPAFLRRGPARTSLLRSILLSICQEEVFLCRWRAHMQKEGAFLPSKGDLLHPCPLAPSMATGRPGQYK